MNTYLLVSQHVRHKELFERLKNTLKGHWHYVSEKEKFTEQYLSDIQPRYIFCPHWSFKIPKNITDNFNCVMFHMTDLPFGRGGSPLQNLIVRGITETKLSAFRCVEALDAGPVYGKLPLSLDGTAREIFKRADRLVSQLIFDIIQKNTEPVEQVGAVTKFKRRLSSQGDIAQLNNLKSVYDYIRMLDAEGYPNAFLTTKTLTLSFSKAVYDGEQLCAQVIFKENK